MDLDFSGAVQAIPNRGITLQTAEKFGYRVGEFKGSKAHFAPYYDGSGQLTSQHVRYRTAEEPKAFAWIGETRNPNLFGMHLWRDAGKQVVITEGELDAMTVSQAFGNKWPVVSLPNGAHSAKKDLARHTAWLERFEKIILCFDMDDAGRKAVEESVTLFTPGKVFVVRLPLKDANEMGAANRSAELVDAIWGAKGYRPDGIRTVSDLREKASQPSTYGLPWPWRTLTERTYGIQRRYMYTWGAGVGTGKSTVQKQLMLTAMRPDLIEPHTGLVDHFGQPLVIPPPRKVGTILFEENPAKTLRSLAGMAIGKRVNKPDVAYSQEEFDAAVDSFDGLLFALDLFGAKDWETVEANIKFLVLSEGVQDIFLDPLTALVAGVEDERRALDSMMADLSGLVETHDFTLHAVSHLTTPTGTAHEEGGRVLEKHFTGSRAIARWSHAMIGLERDKQAAASVTTLRGLKDREYGEAVGPLLGLDFDRDTGRMIEVDLEAAEGPFKNEVHSDL
jgi:twinkle protein